jgi:hypothetical protein
MKVSIREDLKQQIERKLEASQLWPFKEDLEKLLNIYANLELVGKVISSSANDDLSLGEFSIASYSLQVASNNINALSKKFTGFETSDLSLEEESAQNLLLSSSNFSNILDHFFPKELEYSWFNNDRLNAAHCKDFIDFYTTNKDCMNARFFEKAHLDQILLDIQNLFSELLAIDDISLFNIEGNIEPFSELTENFQDLLTVDHNKYHDLILAHKQGLIIENLASLTPGRKYTAEYQSCHKLLIQSVAEAFKQFVQYYNGSDWTATENLTAFHQLRALRNNIAHSKDFTADYHSLIMENYSQLYTYHAGNSLYRALKQATAKVKKIFESKSSEVALITIPESDMIEQENNSALISPIQHNKAGKNKGKNINKSSVSIEDFDKLLSNIIDQDIKEGIRHEHDEFSFLRRKAFEKLDELSSILVKDFFKNLNPNNLNMSLESQEADSLKLSYPKELFDVFKGIMLLCTIDPNILTYNNNVAGSKAFLELLSAYQAKVLFLEILIRDGVNLSQINRSVGNILLPFLKNIPKYVSDNDLKAYEIILQNISEAERLDLISRPINNLPEEAKFYLRLEVPSDRFETKYAPALITKASLLSLAAISDNSGRLFKMLLDYGGNVNCKINANLFYVDNQIPMLKISNHHDFGTNPNLFPQDFIFDLKKQSKLPKKAISMSLLDYCLEVDRFDIALEIVKNENFDINYSKLYYSPIIEDIVKKLQLSNISSTSNFTTLDMILLTIMNNAHPDKIEVLLEIGRVLHNKGLDIEFFTNINNDIIFDLFNRAQNHNAEWLIDICYKHAAKAELFKNAINNLNPKIMECLLKKNILDDVRSKQEFKALTPLDRAILKGSPEIVELLVEYGEELTGKHLEYSIKKNSVELVSLLLSLGQQATTKHIELATEKNNPEIIECLKLSLVQNDILQGYSDEDAMVIDNAQQEHPVEYIGASKEEV